LGAGSKYAGRSGADTDSGTFSHSDTNSNSDTGAYIHAGDANAGAATDFKFAAIGNGAAADYNC
jgi:hypothetical protein